MSINQTEYKIDIESLQSVLEMIYSTPNARLTIEPRRVQLAISNKYAPTQYVDGADEIATALDRTLDHFFDADNDDPIDLALPAESADRQFVVVVQSDNVCDYVCDAAHGHRVDPGIVETALADYRLDDCYTLVFSLDGRPPYLPPNSTKGNR